MIGRATDNRSSALSGKGRGGRLAIAVSIAIGLAGPARAEGDEYQVAWRLAPLSTEPQTVRVEKGGRIAAAALLPDRLLVATGAVRAADGTLLAGDGQQFVGMASRLLMACTLDAGLAGTISAGQRVCLIDEDGDTRFDSYLTRGIGRSAWNSDQRWFVMAGKLTGERAKLAPVAYRDVAPTMLERPPQVELRYQQTHDKSRATRFRLIVGKQVEVDGWCAAYLPIGGSGSARCPVPGFALAMVGREGDAASFTVAPGPVPVAVRFTVRYGWVQGYVVTGMNLTPAVAVSQG